MGGGRYSGGNLATRLGDAAVAVVIGAIVVVAAALDGDANALDYALIATGSLALAGHRAAPRVVLALTTLCLSGYVLHTQPGALALLPVAGAVHTAARSGHRALGAGAAGCFLVAQLFSGPLTAAQANRTLLLAGWLLCAVVTGLADKNWQAYLRQTERRALEAERTREEMARRRAGEERLRIARELHDSLTHSISIVKLQAGVAVHLARKRGDEVPPALLAIQEASGEAMRELRATLEVLRDQPPGQPPGRIEELVGRARSAGLAVDLTVTGDGGDRPAEVDRAAYRIVQEALTNAARHAGQAQVAVRLTHGDGALTVQVTDDGRATPDRPFVPGTGLTGMRERVTALGGTLDAAPRADGGFAVRATLPLRYRPPSELPVEAP
ncbi:sensor histidine kinase [Streptomyces apocyni]|uniref:sensor histidine kinase n=1 Tax=Streptomyces apocyni TaxID=2654677 RepID=UPI0012E9DE6B|nr:sensor histidine kinase [Streptomyces apocyni]